MQQTLTPHFFILVLMLLLLLNRIALSKDLIFISHPDNVIYYFPISPSVSCTEFSTGVETNLTISTFYENEQSPLLNLYNKNQSTTYNYSSPFYSNFTLNVTCTSGGVQAFKFLNYHIVLR